MKTLLQIELKRTGAPFVDRMPRTGTDAAKTKPGGKNEVKAMFAAGRPGLKGPHPKSQLEQREKLRGRSDRRPNLGSELRSD